MDGFKSQLGGGWNTNSLIYGRILGQMPRCRGAAETGSRPAAQTPTTAHAFRMTLVVQGNKLPQIKYINRKTIGKSKFENQKLNKNRNRNEMGEATYRESASHPPRRLTRFHFCFRFRFNFRFFKFWFSKINIDDIYIDDNYISGAWWWRHPPNIFNLVLTVSANRNTSCRFL